MHLKDLKSKTPSDLLKIAEDLKIENAGTLRKQDMIFSILKQMALNNDAIYGEGVLEILQDGFGFLRSPDANYLPGPDDIYVSPSQIKQNSLRTGDTVEGEMRAPRETERYFAITKIDKINFEEIQKTKQNGNFDIKFMFRHVIWNKKYLSEFSLVIFFLLAERSGLRAWAEAPTPAAFA